MEIFNFRQNVVCSSPTSQKKVALDTHLKKESLKPRKPLINQGFSGGLLYCVPMMWLQCILAPLKLRVFLNLDIFQVKKNESYAIFLFARRMISVFPLSLREQAYLCADLRFLRLVVDSVAHRAPSISNGNRGGAGGWLFITNSLWNLFLYWFALNCCFLRRLISNSSLSVFER